MKRIAAYISGKSDRLLKFLQTDSAQSVIPIKAFFDNDRVVINGADYSVSYIFPNIA